MKENFAKHIQKKLTYVRIIAMGYLLVILAGTLLLMLPAAASDGKSTDFLSALFTATSATCVTGLIVVDTASHWTMFGEIVIILMIQVGGLGFMTMGVMMAMLLHQKISLRTRGLLQESMNYMQMGGVVRLVKTAFTGTFLFEGIGALLLMTSFIPVFGIGKGIYLGIFHSISAFCNAGFDLMGTYSGQYSSLTSFYQDDMVNVVIMGLIIIGGIGFFVWSDIRKNALCWKKYILHTKIVLLTTGFLVVFGTLLFLLFEKDNLFVGMSMKDRIYAAAFSSVTARTAGFNTIDTGSLTTASKLLTGVLMFIGGSPGSTAGGIKTVTLAVLMAYVWSNLRGNRGTNIFNRRLDDDTIKKASSVMVISLFMAVSAVIAICHMQPALPVEDIIFEVLSAIGTVGMSTGITRELTTGSRIVIILLMYCGRIGSMSFALSFMERKKVAPALLPVEKVMIG